MSAADYLLCGHCGAKTIYDADVNYDTPALGQIAALCAGCVSGGYKLVLYEGVTNTGRVVMVPVPTLEQLAQTMYEAVWPNSRLEDALPEVRSNFTRMATAAAKALDTTLEDQ